MMDESAERRVEMLDVEDDQARQARIENLLENLNSACTKPTPAMHKFDFGDRTTFPVEPSTALLSRVQAFLPQLEASNNVLSQRMQEDPTSIDIEHISDGMNQYIEMNLGLGLFEDRSKRRSKRDEDSEMSTSSSSDTSDSLDMGDDDDSDEDSDSDAEIITSFVPSRPIRPLPRRVTNPRANIVVLGEDEQTV